MPDKEILLEEKFVAIYYDSINEWIYADWLGDTSPEAGEYGCEQILYFLKEKGCRKLLNDNTNKTGVWSDIIHWMATDWLPRAEAAGLRAFAWVYSPKEEYRIATEETISKLPTNVMTIPFNDIETAKAWLRSV